MTGPISPFTGNRYRYGMLGLILVLFILSIPGVVLSDDKGPQRFMSVAVISMLLLNHIITSFLTPEQQKRIRLVHWIFLAIVLAFVLTSAYQIFLRSEGGVKWELVGTFGAIFLLPIVVAFAIRGRKRTV